jgi:hypothetical protein
MFDQKRNQFAVMLQMLCRSDTAVDIMQLPASRPPQLKCHKSGEVTPVLSLTCGAKKDPLLTVLRSIGGGTNSCESLAASGTDGCVVSH